jgi:hypothetical protein
VLIYQSSVFKSAEVGLGERQIAVDALMKESPRDVYLPGNGGLLAAVALMAVRWDAFPRDTWTVRHEGLKDLMSSA